MIGSLVVLISGRIVTHIKHSAEEVVVFSWIICPVCIVLTGRPVEVFVVGQSTTAVGEVTGMIEAARRRVVILIVMILTMMMMMGLVLTRMMRIIVIFAVMVMMAIVVVVIKRRILSQVLIPLHV